jgi:glucose/mannose transport system permease protein
MTPQSPRTGSGFAERLQLYLPKIILSPTVFAGAFFIYGFIMWTAWVSLTNSRLLPRYELAGFLQYVKLFQNDRWWVASRNLFIFGSLFIGFCVILGLTLAILLDQRIRIEGALRTIYLYPMALSFIVTGTAWRWMLNPGLGLEHLVRQMGFETFTFDWLVNSKMSIYTIVIAGVWQSTGFVMALFLAGLRGIDDSIISAAKVDGASLPRIYWRIIIPSLSFDLVMVLTRGGPGYSSDLPATFMYTFAFTRNRLAFGAASAMMMFMAVMAIIVPYLYSELRIKSNE